jgi:hypothetical protein
LFMGKPADTTQDSLKGIQRTLDKQTAALNIIAEWARSEKMIAVPGMGDYA